MRVAFMASVSEGNACGTVAVRWRGSMDQMAMLRDLGGRLLRMMLASVLAAVTLVALVALVLLVATTVARAGEAPTEFPGPKVPTDPRQGEVPLPSPGGWNASLVLDNQGVGVWTVKCFPFFRQFGCPELVAVDDRGRLQVLVSYSGRWTPRTTIHEGTWLGGLAYGDVDPRFEGGEIYTGGLLGNLYQVLPKQHGMMDARLIAQMPGHEIHTIVAGRVDGRVPGPVLLVFTRPGGLYRLRPTGPHGTWEKDFLGELPGRVRDAVVLPPGEGESVEIATVSRDGALRVCSDGLTKVMVPHRTTMGMGRLALRPGSTARSTVLYATLDDGRVLRHERKVAGWTTETIYAGPQGLRGVAAGRFHQDAAVETVAVYGYAGKVQLLTRGEKGWSVETLFVNDRKGHWLCAAELDGRNATDELVASGFGGRVVLLARPPGYGLEGVATDPVPEEEEKPLEEEPESKTPAPAPGGKPAPAEAPSEG
jgi:hypothetical protein